MRLECHNLNYIYPGSRSAVIKDMSFSMESPGFNAIFGPSGVGKTSLARLITSPGDRMGQSFFTRQIKTIHYSYNLERLPGWSSTGIHLDKVTPEGKEEFKQELVDIFELNDVVHARFAKLSMGQQNRINLIRYLLQEFDLLILDESLANVDETLRQKIILAIKDLFDDKMFIYISHNLMEVSKFCNQILVMGKSPGAKNYCMIQGQDYKTNGRLDKNRLDQTMLEIMNAV